MLLLLGLVLFVVVVVVYALLDLGQKKE